MIRGLIRTLILAVMPAAVSAGMVDDVWRQAPPQTDRLGLAFPTNDPDAYDAMADMGMGLVRVSASWGRVGHGAFDFSGLDYRLTALGQLGIAGFITFESDHRRLARHTGRVKNGSPRDLVQWRRFVTAVVERYDGDGVDDMPGLLRPVAYVQAGNEFLRDDNRSGGWAGSDQALVDYFNATYDAVKAADAEMPVALGGIAAFNMDLALMAEGHRQIEVRQNWSDTSRTRVTMRDLSAPEHRAALTRLEVVLDQARFDLVDVHLYGPIDRDGLRLSWLTGRTGRPALSSECGGPTTDYGTTYSGHRHFTAVLERNLATLANGGRICMWFGLNERLETSYSNRNTPLFQADMTPKPGVLGYRLLGSLLSGEAPVRQIGPRQYAIESPVGLICAAFGQAAKALPLTDCYADPNSLCVLDAGTRTAQLVPVATLPDTCRDEAVALSGPGLRLVLERNRQR